MSILERCESADRLGTLNNLLILLEQDEDYEACGVVRDYIARHSKTFQFKAGDSLETLSPVSVIALNLEDAEEVAKRAYPTVKYLIW